METINLKINEKDLKSLFSIANRKGNKDLKTLLNKVSEENKNRKV